MTDLHLTLMQLLALAACCAVNLALVAICLAIRFGDPEDRPLTALRGQVIPVRSRAGVRRAATLDHPALKRR